jgi:hypothetical protein
MKGRWGDPIKLVITVEELHSSTSHGQSQWDEIVYTGADGERGVIRIERRRNASTVEEPVRRLSL